MLRLELIRVLKTLGLTRIVMGRVLFSKFWPFLKVLVFLFKLMPGFLHLFLWSLATAFSGPFAVLFRYLSFSARVERFDKNSYIGSHVVLKNLHKLQVGENFSLHDFCYVDAVGGVKVGNNVSIAHGSSLISFNHSWGSLELPIKYNPISKAPIVIEDDVWVGCGVRIMSGVTIGKRSVVAAGSVVVKDVPANTVVGGVPAKFIKFI